MAGRKAGSAPNCYRSEHPDNPKLYPCNAKALRDGRFCWHHSDVEASRLLAAWGESDDLTTVTVAVPSAFLGPIPVDVREWTKAVGAYVLDALATGSSPG